MRLACVLISSLATYALVSALPVVADGDISARDAVLRRDANAEPGAPTWRRDASAEPGAPPWRRDADAKGDGQGAPPWRREVEASS